MSIDWTKIKHFTPEEFDDPDLPGSVRFMRPETIFLLDQLREKTGWPIVTHNKFGIRGAVCAENTGHSKNSFHYIDHPEGCSAVDWHYVTQTPARKQALSVLQSGFAGIGIYYDWKWGGKLLLAGFHTDLRKRPQVWKRENNQYLYLLK